MNTFTRRLGLMALALLAVFLAMPGLAAAATDPVAPVAIAGDSTSVALTPMAWTIITGLLLPFLVGLVTRYEASTQLKAVIGVILAAVAAIVERATLADGSAVFTTGLLVDVLLVYGPQLLSYVGLYGHFDINKKLLPNKGLG